MTGIKMPQNTTGKDWPEYSIKFAFVLLWHLFIIHWFVCNTHTFKNTLKAFGDFKKKQKCVRSNVFWYVKVCIFWKCIQYIIQWDKAQMLNKFVSDKLNGAKYVPFFSRAATYHSLTFDLRFWYEVKQMVCLYKTVC